MWDGLLLLLVLSIVMGGASFLAGAIPLSFTLSPRQLRLLTALGTGVLVGTSLIVIIPEGVEAVYAASEGPHNHKQRDLSHNVRRAPESDFFAPFQGLWIRHAEADAEAAAQPGASNVDTIYVTESEEAYQKREELDAPFGDKPAGNDNGYIPMPPDEDGGFVQDDSPPDHDPHVWVGTTLIFGFILMYLIDTIPQSATAYARPQRFAISLNQFSFNRTSSTGAEDAETPSADNSSRSSISFQSSPTTIGLVIHATADGIALGASSTTSSSRLSFIIFLALMIHKAPAAFGLTSVLLKQGLTKRMARAHLIIFSLAAPVGALITWAAVHLLGFSGGSMGTEFATGVLLLFSGGTFLYVAMHTMQENGADAHGQGNGHGSNGYAGVPMDDPYSAVHGGPPPPKQQGPAMVDTAVTVAGMLLPLLTQWGHVH